ncbi:MAG TPA: hypothetical protein VJU78_17700 [Chitinophagaceae bacterium]|nr:hypothetical protein [Chitinophagaceae bacterium]
MKFLAISLLLFSVTFTSSAQPDPIVITLKNTELFIPEGIAVDSKTGDIYITSINLHKIVVAKKDESYRDFIASGKEGFGEGLGIKIDEKRNRVWAVSNKKEGSWFMSQIHVFDKSTAEPTHVFINKDTVNHLFNDLAIDNNGNAWITATNSGKLFYADTRSGKLSIACSDSLLQYPNGIALHHNKLYIATYSHGLLIYDPDQKRIEKLKGYNNKTYAFNLDGLGIYKNNLLGVYNTDSLNSNNATIEYKLDKTGSAITAEKIIQKGHPLFREPTTLAIAGNKLYVLANSNLGVYNANKESVKGVEQKLSPVTILLYNLDAK